MQCNPKYTPSFRSLDALSSFSVSDVPFSEQAMEQAEQRNKRNNGTVGTSVTPGTAEANAFMRAI
jgi:hypothetical protein